MTIVSEKKVVRKMETHVLCPVTYFFFENRTVYEKTWKNIVEGGMPRITIRRMRIACWIPKNLNEVIPLCIDSIYSLY